MRLRLLKFPNKLLSTKSTPVIKFDEKLKLLAGAMHFAMKQWNGLGLSAVQIGRPIQLIVIDTMQQGGEKITIVNPEIIGTSKELFSFNEGCLSFDGKFLMNSRPRYVDIKYKDVEGTEKIRTLEDLTAFCFMHEYDHLCGITLNDIENQQFDKDLKICNNDTKE